MTNIFKRSSLVLVATLLSATYTTGCAVLHHVQIGQIDDRSDRGEVLVPFTVMVSETGISTQEIGAIAKATQTRAGDGAAGVAGIVALFQIGPRTGNPIYDQRYAERMIYQIHEKCPTGRITGLSSIREMRKYPVISGEIVKVSGYCRKPRVQPNLGDPS